MRKRDLDAFRKLLEERHATLFRTAFGELRDELLQPPVHDEGPGDEGDEAARFQNQDLRINLVESETLLAQRIEDALARMRAGTFGTCVECGTDIETKRLRSVPWAARCIECQEALEMTARGRPPTL
jgi:DnaK suppressor protein